MLQFIGYLTIVFLSFYVARRNLQFIGLLPASTDRPTKASLREDSNTQAKETRGSVDMTPPVLSQSAQAAPILAANEPTISWQLVNEMFAEPASGSRSDDRTSVATTKNRKVLTANDAKAWGYSVCRSGLRKSNEPMAVRSTDPRRRAEALRRQSLAMEQAARVQKETAAMARKVRARLKKYRQGLLEASTQAAEEALLQRHLEEGGIV
ncbi:hypothetical protein [Rhodanobacter sp. FW106-PBR-R2A-1-13]|uniref:hypothetical protein n=1 Tax=Rhodanobacter sp. FW106-PBR-R2A-1-13 TaxID=3454845 RepID=UPI0034E5ADC0